MRKEKSRLCVSRGKRQKKQEADDLPGNTAVVRRVSKETVAKRSHDAANAAVCMRKCFPAGNTGDSVIYTDSLKPFHRRKGSAAAFTASRDGREEPAG